MNSSSMEVDGAMSTVTSSSASQLPSCTPSYTVRGMDIMGEVSNSSGADMADSTTPPAGSLKRSSSAPMINMIVATNVSTSITTSVSSSTFHDVNMRDRSQTLSHPPVMETSHQPPSEHHHPLSNHFVMTAVSHHRPADMSHRIRRYSASASQGLHSPSSRLNQLKFEEQESREIAHERETQSTMQISNSCEEWSIDDTEPRQRSKTISIGEPLHIFTSPYPYSSSPSPTRVGRQCFSPALQQPIKGSTLSPSPSPTRKFSRRSLSPITLRPSPLSGIKRKMDVDDSDRMDTYHHSPKRIHYGNLTPERLTNLPNPFSSSVSSSSSLDDSINSDQQIQSLPGLPSLPGLAANLQSSVLNDTTHTPTHTPAHTPAHTPNHTPTHTPTYTTAHSTTYAPSFSFRPVRDSIDTNQTDSECSDMTETTDISDTCDVSDGTSGHQPPSTHS